MKIKGKIVRKRPYFDHEDGSVNCITFLEVENAIIINGESIKIIPILCTDSTMTKAVGENIEVEGEIEYKRIFTSSGKRCLSPIPTLRSTACC
jgi:hypothetical protein